MMFDILFGNLYGKKINLNFDNKRKKNYEHGMPKNTIILESIKTNLIIFFIKIDF